MQYLSGSARLAPGCMWEATVPVSDKPLFVPLKTEWLDAFASGQKTSEWRAHGPRWNAGTCWPGRAVILSHGYSGARLHARIAKVRYRTARTRAQVAFFGEGTECIVLELIDIHPA